MIDSTELEDSELVRQACSGNVNAFESLYRRHSPRVYGLCIRLTGNQTEAQDCTQETFISAWKHLGEFRGNSTIITWLHRIAVNAVLSRQRKNSSERRHLEAIETTADHEPGESGVLIDLERAISRLPDRAREVFVLHKIYGYMHEEVANMMGIAVGTCKAQIHRANKLLKAALPVDTTKPRQSPENSRMQEDSS